MTDTNELDASNFGSLHERTRGEVLHPGDDGYTEARTVWNGMVDHYPSVVVRANGTADVMAAVDAAREHDLPLSVKGGGHNVAGKAVVDDGLVIDCSGMDSVRVDPETETARVGPGATWRDFDHEAQAFGLATTGGVDSRTGVAGLTLGGGIGHLARSCGLACDNLVGADVVTADGDLVHASEDENPDLFWGLRGGGGGLGIVTSFEFRLHEVGPEILAGPVLHPLDDAVPVLRFYRDFVAEAPDEVACYALFAVVPPEEPFPPEYHGETALYLVPSYAGSIADGESALRELRTFGDPILDGVAPIPYTALQQSFDDGTPDGERYYYKSHYVEAPSDDAIETIVEYARERPGPFTNFGFEPLGGAVGRVDPTATAYPHREASYSFGIWGGWSDPDRDDEVIEWVREFHDEMVPYATGGAYANYLDRDDDQRTAAYGQNYERLVAVRDEWNPENRFRGGPE